MRRTWGGIVAGTALLAWVAGSPPASAQAPSEVPLLDSLEIVLGDRELLAVGAQGGGQRSLDLERGERVRWVESRGRVGVVLTDRRILAVATRSAAWQETRYRASEQHPERARLGERVALVLTNQRVIGFDGNSGNLVESRLGPREAIASTAVGRNVVVVATNRRALGLSPFVGGFFERRLRLGESLVAASARASVATLTTSRRLLIFRAASGSWEERRLDLR